MFRRIHSVPIYDVFEFVKKLVLEYSLDNSKIHIQFMLQCEIKVQMAKRINLYVRSRTNDSNIASYCWIVQEQQREHIKSGIRGKYYIYGNIQQDDDIFLRCRMTKVLDQWCFLIVSDIGDHNRFYLSD